MNYKPRQGKDDPRIEIMLAKGHESLLEKEGIKLYQFTPPGTRKVTLGRAVHGGIDVKYSRAEDEEFGVLIMQGSRRGNPEILLERIANKLPR